MSDSDYTSVPNWSDEQWARVCKVVSDEAQKSRIAAQFLPLYGPVAPDLVAVPNFRLRATPPPAGPFAPARDRFIVDSTPDDFLTTISVQIPLPTHQVADPELGAALTAFRRAALTIARIEDAIVFNGQPGAGIPPVATFPGGWLAALPPVYSVTGGAAQPGLVPAGIVALPGAVALAPVLANVVPRVPVAVPTPAVGSPLAAMRIYAADLVLGVSRAITALEGNGQSGPFACFFSPHAYDAAHTPDASLVLARDRILPFLGGDYLRRTNTIPEGYGIVVALGGGPVEIVVARDITVRYQQQTPEPRYLFRVSEKIALRVKEWNAVAVLHPPSPSFIPWESTMPQSVKPVAPSLSDIRAQLRESIKAAIKVAEGHRDTIKNDGTWKTIRDAKQAHAKELDKRTTDLTKNLHAEKDLEKQKELILAHQEVFERGVVLDKKDAEYKAKLKGYEDEIQKLNDDLDKAGD
jgi:uncharacterized linocin/CFP29 family protein